MIEIINQQHRYWLNIRKFKELLKRLSTHYKLNDPEITLVFTDNRAIKKLNKQYLKKDAPTDVLSFPIGEKGADGKYYLGDIVISVPQAFKQCFSEEHGLERELEFLTIHGFLHLLGYEHSEGIEEEEEKMENLLSEN
ncbi:MAG: rRNA maturation RNase YbeY [Candidatus Aminicenantes bacterium]|nr:rRNA maturation RNase YbeY [Candidatus Aminicenantes bacterium]